MDKKKLNALAAEYKTLKEEISEREKRAEAIGKIFKEMGSMQTEDFIITVTDQSRTQLGSLAKAEEALGREILEKNDLINTVTFKVIRVADRTTED